MFDSQLEFFLNVSDIYVQELSSIYKKKRNKTGEDETWWDNFIHTQLQTHKEKQLFESEKEHFKDQSYF